MCVRLLRETARLTRDSAMEQEDRIQHARYEFKYLVTPSTAEQIRRFVLAYLEPDYYTQGKEGLGYAVHSLYVDTRDLRTCRAVIQGERNRFKLRLRFYDDNPKNPVFFEIKRRANVVIMKQRAAVRRPRVPALLDGANPSPADLWLPEDDKHLSALRNFCVLRDKLHAVPAAYTSYMREGYEVRGDNAVRVTFDRQLKAGQFHGSLDISDLEQWAQPEMGGVVLELKFTDRFPEWMHTLVQCYNLTRVGFPKYVKCVSLVRGFSADTGVPSDLDRFQRT